MNTYRVTFELHYPECVNDIREAYVLAEDFRQAQNKVEKRYKEEWEKAQVLKMEYLKADIIV